MNMKLTVLLRISPLLAHPCPDNVGGAFLGTDEAREEGALDPADLATVEALTELGYVSVPEELLESDYEGPSALEHFAARPTWWTRFFGLW